MRPTCAREAKLSHEFCDARTQRRVCFGKNNHGADETPWKRANVTTNKHLQRDASKGRRAYAKLVIARELAEL